MAKITANNIFTGAITSDKLDSSVASNLATANNANVVATIASTVAAAAFSTANNLSSILANSAPIITSITIADSSYNALDDTAANTTGGFCIITGSGFVSTPTVVFGTTSASAVSFINATTLRVQIPALTAASYPVYVVNSNGGTAIRVNGLTTSSFPAWSTGATLSNQAANTAFSVNLSASSDSNITYSNTTSLPAGTTLAANGLFSGTVSIGTQTTYTFDVKATDVENQDATRTFSLTVTVAPQYRLYTWGNNTDGALGQNDRTHRSSPVQVGSGTDWSFVASGAAVTAAIKSNGTLWTWGGASWGQLGTNDNVTTRSSPTQVGSGTDWSTVVIGQSGLVVLAIKTNGTLWAWGYNNLGALGTNDIVARSSPVQIGSNTNWSKIGSYSGFSAAIKTDGTLWSWGQNSFGNLGHGDGVYRSSPTQVGSATNWSKLANGSLRAGFLAIRSDGTLWGSGSSSTIGAPGTNVMTQIGALTNWSLVTGLRYAALAVKNDGTLWAWGYNDVGQLGRNGTIDISNSSPIQIGSNTNWSNVFGGWQNSFATKTDGTLWAWGTNTLGQLGQNNTIYRSSPTQVGTSTSWTANTYCGENAVSFIQQT